MEVRVRTCPSCGVDLADSASYCHVCGARTPTGAFTADSQRQAASETRRRLLQAIGKDYDLRELLGAGGFAEVYLAWDRRLKRDVALKTLRAEISASPEVVARFRREAESIAQLRHPHIVPIFAVSEAHQTAWFAMPRINGVSLAEALKSESRWSFAEVCRILREASGALATAHAAGIVHRDIKPENIMLEGPERRVVLMDFGIAKSASKATGSLTATGILVGTPQYMSPEQAAGESSVGPLSDQYSLGLVGYRLLTGRPAFTADSLRSLVMMQAAAPPVPIGDLRPDVPRALSQAIERTLAKDPSQRFTSMLEFAEALDRVARDVAGEFRRGRRAVPLQDRWSDARHRLREIARPAAIAAIVGIVLIATTTKYTLSSAVHRALANRDEAFFASRAAAAGQKLNWQGFVTQSDLYDFLERAVGHDSADRVATAYGAWGWEFDYLDQATRISTWYTYDSTTHLSQLFVIIPDSIPKGALTEAVGRLRADSVLRANGEDPARLTFAGVDSTAYMRYTTRLYKWYRPGYTIIRGGDTARMVIKVAFSGARLTRFEREGELKAAIAPTSRNSLLVDVALTIMPFLLITIALVAIVVVGRRASLDVIQWAIGLRIGAVILVLWFALITIGIERGYSIWGMLSSSIMSQVPRQLSVWLLAAVCLVGAESLWYETRPHLMQGLDDIARARFSPPELVHGTLAGYGAGLLLAGLGCAAVAAAHRGFGVPYAVVPALQMAFEHRLPGAMVLLPLTFSIFCMSAVMFVAGLLQRRRGMAIYACVFMAILAVTSLSTMFRRTELTIFVALLTVIPVLGLRHGFVSAVLALWIALATPILTDFYWTGGPYLGAAIFGTALMLAPAIWATRIWARRPRTPSVATAFPG